MIGSVTTITFRCDECKALVNQKQDRLIWYNGILIRETTPILCPVCHSGKLIATGQIRVSMPRSTFRNNIIK